MTPQLHPEQKHEVRDRVSMNITPLLSETLVGAAMKAQSLTPRLWSADPGVFLLMDGTLGWAQGLPLTLG